MKVGVEYSDQLVEILEQIVTEDHRMHGTLHQLYQWRFHDRLHTALKIDLPVLHLDLEHIVPVGITYVDDLIIIIKGYLETVLAAEQILR